MFFKPNHWLIGARCVLPEQVAESVERSAVGKTQALRIGRTPVNGEAVEVGVVVGMVVEMHLNSSVLAQLVVKVKLTHDVRSIAAIVARHQAQVGLNGQVWIRNWLVRCQD